jgi:hypothetical protein
MSFIVAHAAHVWLEVALFAPAGVVVTFAIARSVVNGRGGASSTRSTTHDP